MLSDAEPAEADFAEKRRTRLIIHRAPTPGADDGTLSYFGGLPKLPPELSWPTVPRREEDGDGDGAIVPTFIAQLDLATLPIWRGRELLPEFGTIYVFCNTQFCSVGDPYCKVLYYKGSSAKFAERAPPANLMRIGGVYDYLFRSWVEGADPACGIDNKFALAFEWAPNSLSDFAMPEFEHPEWARQLYMFSSHPLLMQTWPQTPLFVSTLRDGLIAQAGRSALSYNGERWPGHGPLLELIQSLPQLGGERFRWLDDAERRSFRAFIADFAPLLDAKSKGAARFHGGSYSLQKFIDECAFWCTARGFAEGAFNEETASGELFAAMKSAAERWRHWKWPHQILGAGTVVQSAPYECADKALLLQVSGVDFLAGSVTDGVLQFWIPAEEMKAGNFDGVSATLECS